MRSRLLSFALTLIILASSVLPAMHAQSACPETSPSSPVVQVQQEITPSIKSQIKAQRRQERQFMRAVSEMEKHLFVDGGALKLDIEDGDSIGIDKETFAALKFNLEETNNLLRVGELSISEVRLSTEATIVGNRDVGGSLDLQACAGLNGVRNYWWGQRFYFDTCKTQVMVGLLTVGAGASALCAVFTPARIPCGVVAAILTIGAGALYALDALGGFHGVYIARTRGGVTWVWHQ